MDITALVTGESRGDCDDGGFLEGEISVVECRSALLRAQTSREHPVA